VTLIQDHKYYAPYDRHPPQGLSEARRERGFLVIDPLRGAPSGAAEFIAWGRVDFSLGYIDVRFQREKLNGKFQ
jgi:hypothetical protein